MKILKRISALYLALCLCFGCVNTSFASTTDKDMSVSTNSAHVILYEDDEVILYQDKSENTAITPLIENAGIAPLSDDNYGNVWLNQANAVRSGSFPVNCTYTGNKGITFKIESSSNSSYAQVYMTKGKNVVFGAVTVRPSDGDLHCTLKNASRGTYAVHCMVLPVRGMRIMCWIY